MKDPSLFRRKYRGLQVLMYSPGGQQSQAGRQGTPSEATLNAGHPHCALTGLELGWACRRTARPPAPPSPLLRLALAWHSRNGELKRNVGGHVQAHPFCLLTKRLKFGDRAAKPRTQHPCWQGQGSIATRAGGGRCIQACQAK